jgi:hypothetical protein
LSLPREKQLTLFFGCIVVNYDHSPVPDRAFFDADANLEQDVRRYRFFRGFTFDGIPQNNQITSFRRAKGEFRIANGPERGVS